VSVELTRADGYVLVVSDNGPGIDPALLPQMFQPFRQVDSSPTRQQGGLGLGLAIVRQIVEMHGGTVTARSDGAGTGARFEVRLPSVLSSEDRPVSPSPTAAGAYRAGPSLLAGIRVLVVDDEEDARELLKTVFGNRGALVTTVASAADALHEVDRAVPDVIVSDIGMPLEDGYSLIRRLRARPEREVRNVPAVAVTAYASAADREKAIAAGYQAHVAKPFEPDQVVHVVHDLARTEFESKSGG
jgi:CheY-like chemotaxis protein